MDAGYYTTRSRSTRAARNLVFHAQMCYNRATSKECRAVLITPPTRATWMEAAVSNRTPESNSIQLSLPFEEWRDIPGYDGMFQVSDMGRVKRIKQGGNKKAKPGFLKPSFMRGYYFVNLYKDRTKTKWPVHRLVMLAFVGPCPDGLQVNHINGTGTDNRLANLEYVTGTQNMWHKNYVLKRLKKGEEIGNHKLKSKQVWEIRDLLATGMPKAQIARLYNVKETTIRDIGTGRRWSHLRSREDE